MIEGTIGFIGAGRMGEALIRGLINSGEVKGGQILASDKDKARLEHMSRLYKIKTSIENGFVVRNSGIIIFAVKPQVMGEVLESVKGSVTKDKLLISIVAGKTTSWIRERLGSKFKVIRVMPNSPALVLQGMSAIYPGVGVKRGERKAAEAIFGAIGRVVFVDDESLLDAVTGLSGSGPAYAFLIIEALSDGGVKMGLDRATSYKLAAQTLLGASQMILEMNRHPGELKDMVTSPGGTTIDGLKVLEEGGIRGLIIKAVEMAAKRARELGEE